MPMPSELQPCPKCRQFAAFSSTISPGGQGWYAGCVNPKCTFMPSFALTLAIAAKEWNQRKVTLLKPYKSD